MFRSATKLRAERAIKKFVENRGKSMSAAMRAVGFSPAYASNPDQFLKTKTAQQLLDEYLPDELVSKTHYELLVASEIQHYLFPKLSKDQKGEKKELSNEEIRTIVESVPGCRLIYVKRDIQGAWAFFQAPDTKSRKEAVDMAYKRKGDYAPEKIQMTKRKYQDLSNEELMDRINTIRNFLLKKKR